jgi:hypothetical protein
MRIVPVQRAACAIAKRVVIPRRVDVVAELAELRDRRTIDRIAGADVVGVALSERAMTALPIEKDAVFGPFPIEIFARSNVRSAAQRSALPETGCFHRAEIRLAMAACRA